MNTKLFNVFMFATGAAIGSVVTWKLLKTKYEQIAQEGIDSVKETFSRLEFESCEEIDEDTIEDEPIIAVTTAEVHEPKKPNLRDYAKIITQENYTNDVKQKEEEDQYMDRPYVISPEEFGEMDDYETISLTYYSDGIVADDQDNVIEDVDVIIGVEALSHFGEYEDDSVFVRNDERRCDYEILLDYRKYYEEE